METIKFKRLGQNLSVNGQVLLHVYAFKNIGLVINKIDELINIPTFIELLHL